MTLSSSSRQHRKSMLPTPRLSSRLSSRRIALSDTSRITRRVPSPLLATPYDNGSTAPVRVLQPVTASCDLPLPAASRIPTPLGQTTTSCSIPEQCDASSLISTPRTEVKRVADAQYPTPPSSADPKDEQRLESQEGRVIPAQNQEPGETRNLAAPSGRLGVHIATARRPASTAFAAGFSRVDNTSFGEGAGAVVPMLARKKLALTSTVSGKENRRPQLRTRVPPPPVPVASAPVTSAAAAAAAATSVPPPPRSIRRLGTVAAVAQSSTSSSRASFRKNLLHPLVIEKRSSQSPGAVGSPQGDARVGPAGIKALMEDIDCFAKEWTEMFEELSVGVDCPETRPSKLDLSMRIHPTGQFQAPSGPVAPSSILQTSTLDRTNGETVRLDVMSLASRQHSDKAMAEDSPLEDELERDSPAVGSDLPSDGGLHHPEKPVLRNASLPATPQVSRHYLPLPEINQSPIISGSHLAEMTSVAPLNRKDELSKLSESHLATPRSTETARRNGVAFHARCYPPATLPSVSFSPFSTMASLSSASTPYSISPWINLQGHDLSPRRSVRAASDAAPTRSASVRGLRAIFKRTSAGLTGGQRQRAESLKELIGEPRVLSLGSVSITNLRDAGVAGGCGPEESAATTGELARKTTVKW